ncbi:MAG: T9SS type A sorting domain-containing protein [Polaribacter sp.]|uniref:T9SS type A sorting domain-containing protein n=1 Tax=Polaribacter sp. TaxID=1920175 RepID=UPI002F35FF66
MKKNYFITLLLIFVSLITFSQTTLVAGDLVVIEMQGDTNDGFRFVPLVDLDAGTVVKFTDNGWTGTVLRSGEGTVLYTAPTGGITAGTNIRYTVGDMGDFSLDGGDINISSGGDQILVYQGNSSAPTFIFAAAGNSSEWQSGSNDSNQSDLPTGLTDGVNAVAAGAGAGSEAEFDNIYYNGITTGTKVALLAAVASDSNWVGDNTDGYTALTANFTITAPSTDPSLTIIAPSDGATIASTTSVAVTISLMNFNFSADNGSGMGDGSGDGYIKSTFETQGGSTEVTSFFSATLPNITVIPGSTYTLTLELVDNAGASLSTAVSDSTTFTIAFPCVLALDTISTSCDALTSGVDTYNGSITFTGGNTGITYTITAKDDMGNDVGTIGGDNPDASATGSITVTGIPEGTDVDIKVVGGTGSTCDFTRNFSSLVCKPFPVYESFDYTVGTDLIASTDWQDASTSSTANNIQVVAGTMGNPFNVGEFPNPVGAMVNLVGSGSDPYIGFNATSTGTLYASFIFSPTDISTMTDTTDGGYFVALAESGGSFRSRLYIRQTAADNTMYELGVSESGSATNFDTTLSYTPGEQTFIVMSYELATNEIKVWANPDPATFEGTPGTANLSHTSSSTAVDLGRFILRQDSTGETPSINFDELRIGTSWAQVTPKMATASVSRNNIEGFTTYPNPITDKKFTISSTSSSVKQVVIFNVLGKKVFSSSFSGEKKNIDVSGVNAGIYILKVTENGKTATKKLVIR